MNEIESLAFQVLRKQSTDGLNKLHIPPPVLEQSRDGIAHGFAYADTHTKVLLQMVGFLFGAKEESVPLYLIVCEYLFNNFEKHGLSTEEVADAVYIAERYHEVQSQLS